MQSILLGSSARINKDTVSLVSGNLWGFFENKLKFVHVLNKSSCDEI